MPLTVLINDYSRVKKPGSSMTNDKCKKKIRYSSLSFCLLQLKTNAFWEVHNWKSNESLPLHLVSGKSFKWFWSCRQSDFPLPASVEETAITCSNSHCCWAVLCCDGNRFNISVKLICSTKFSNMDTNPNNLIMI